MKTKTNRLQSLNFRSRKIVHYSLIACILLIQIIIAAFFYNEFVNKKNLAFIEKQLQEVDALENLTTGSRNDLLQAQDFLQKYVMTQDEKNLKSYFAYLDKLKMNLDRINNFQEKYPYLKTVFDSQNDKSFQSQKLKMLIDSTYEYTQTSDFRINNESPRFKKYKFDYDFNKFEIQTKTYKDTVKKKGFFGRLGDAISGRENVRKDSTVVILKEGRDVPDVNLVKSEFDSILTKVNDHYSKEIKKIQLHENSEQKKNISFHKVFSNLLVYSNGVMNIYDLAIKNSKEDLQKEYNLQNSKNSKIRTNLVLGAMILMFLISVLIMLLTRIAFGYEKRLKLANAQIRENLNFKNRILGMLSHELRSPLKIIGLFLGRINKKTSDDSIKDYLKSISFTNNTLLMQANQILEYTKNQHVENKLVPVVFNLKDEIDSILKSLEPYIETRNNKFIIHENIDSSVEVFSDNTKINQVFMNIIGNANKFTEYGEISVNVFTNPVDETKILMTAEISDTGAGISASDLEKIFEPYYQGVISDEVENLGAGLGLSLCREIVELYEGTICVSSEIGKGTRVTFSMYLQLNNEQKNG